MIEGFEAWLRDGGAGGRPLGESTLVTYLRVARKIVRTSKPTDILRPELSASTKNKYVAVLRQWAVYTADDELASQLVKGPRLHRLLQARKSKLPEKIEAFTDDEVKRFLEIVNRFRGQEPAWVWPAVSLQIHLGLRVGADLCGLRRDAVKRAIASGRLAVMGKRERMDYLPASFVKDELEALIEIPGWDVVADLISPDTAGAPEHLHREQAYQAYRRALILLDGEAKIGAHKTHRFRHWAITNFVKKIAKGDLKRAQRFARHSSLETTLRYYRTVDLAEDDEALSKLKEER